VTNLDYAGDAGNVIQMKGSSLLMFLMWKVAFEKLKSVQILTISPWDSNPCPTLKTYIMGDRVMRLRACLIVKLFETENEQKLSIPLLILNFLPSNCSKLFHSVKQVY
jgi:hypothetical protein